MKILLPTDFSKLSKIAIRYAIALTQDKDLEIVLIHVVNTLNPNMARLGSRKMSEAIKSSSELGMKRLHEAVKKEIDPKLKISSYVVHKSSIVRAIEDFAIEHNIDMICIGTKGATGLKKVVLGSNAAGIISHSSIPVLTIPEYATYNGIKNMVYSSDLNNLESEFSILLPYAKRLDSWVHILHINQGSDNIDKELQEKENNLKATHAYPKISAKDVHNNSIINGINDYVSETNADLVAMFTHKTTLFDKSITKQAAFQAKTPLLTFHKE